MVTDPKKQHAHELIERLEDAEVTTAIRFLEFILLDPVARALATARPDDELVTEEDRRRFRTGQSWFAERGGEGISMEDVLRDFDLRLEDFPSVKEKA